MLINYECKSHFLIDNILPFILNIWVLTFLIFLKADVQSNIFFDVLINNFYYRK